MKRKKLNRFLLVLTMGFIFSLGFCFVAAQWILSDLPKLDQVEDYEPYQVSRVFDSAHNLLAEFYIEKRTLIDVATLPKNVRNAFLAAEDADFYQHQGIDYFGILRAVLNEIKYQIIGGQRIGGSTITQQTAKTMLLGRQRTYTRKIKEFILAKRIEDALSKEQILNLYLNQIYFGNGAYGLEEAAQTYYSVHAQDLTLSQAASLAAVPKSPNKINPIKDPERVLQRRDYVLEQMVIHGFITEAMGFQARQEPIRIKLKSYPYLNKAPYYAEEVKRFLINKLGEDALYKEGFSIYTGLNMPMQVAANEALRWGLRTLDKRQGFRGPVARLPDTEAITLAEHIQSQAPKHETNSIVMGVVHSLSKNKQEAMIHLSRSQKGTLSLSRASWARPFNPERYTPIPKNLSSFLKVGDIIWVHVDSTTPNTQLSLEQKPLVEGALVAIHPQTHRILAMVGGYDFSSSNFNRATQAKRQPGSSFKPFVYAAAINSRTVNPATLIDDAPKEYEHWKPRNVTRKFLGNITLRTCLTASVNMCSIELLEKVGVRSILDLADQAGEITPDNPLPRDLTLALGTGEVIPLLHVNAYTIFPNAGFVAQPVLIEKIVSPLGLIVYQHPEEEAHSVISPAAAFVMTNMMRGLMAGAGKRTTGLTAPLAGKTGTTNEFRSAWFLGFSQDLVAGVYVGFDDNRSLGINEYGAVAALPIWGQFMTRALQIMPAREFVQPEGIVWRLIDPKTGNIASSNILYDPGSTTTHAIDESEVAENTETDNLESSVPVMEAFIAGTEPGASLPAAIPNPSMFPAWAN